MERIDSVVVGAGVVGLAIARALARAGREVVILEAEGAIGSVTSARNSEVIHAGLYSQADWLKTRLCVEGRRLLYPYCERTASRTGAAASWWWRRDDEQVPALRRGWRAMPRPTASRACALIDGAAARALEPALRAAAALHSTRRPASSTATASCSRLLGEAEDHGAALALKSPLVARAGRAGRLRARRRRRRADAPARALPRQRAPGCAASDVAARIDGLAAGARARAPTAARATTSRSAACARRSRAWSIRCTMAAGLGVHLTLDLGGQGRFGPDTEWLADDGAIDYARRRRARRVLLRRDPPLLAGPARRQPAARLQRRAPEARAARARPRRTSPSTGPTMHGVPGLVNLFGIESPGLTASLAIAERVRSALDGD